MAYTPFHADWHNQFEATDTPITAEALEYIETGISNAANTADAAVPKSTVAVSGDLIFATSAATVNRLPLGAAGTVLKGGAAAPSYGQVGDAEISTISPSKITGLGATQTYTPTWTGAGSNPVIGNGTISGRYIQIGKLVFCWVTVAPGSTTTFGTGIYSFALPVTAVSGDLGNIGVAHGRDGSASADYVGAVLITTTTSVAVETYASPTVNWTNTVPFTWANTDHLYIHGVYEAA